MLRKGSFLIGQSYHIKHGFVKLNSAGFTCLSYSSIHPMHGNEMDSAYKKCNFVLFRSSAWYLEYNGITRKTKKDTTKKIGSIKLVSIDWGFYGDMVGKTQPQF